MKTIINNTQYKIKPRMKKRWFRKDIKVYDVLEISNGKFWSDPSYGNGGGDYINFEKEQVLYTFNTFIEADSFRQDMENFAKIK